MDLAEEAAARRPSAAPPMRGVGRLGRLRLRLRDREGALRRWSARWRGRRQDVRDLLAQALATSRTVT